jgi:hypothetical protein
MVSVGPPGIKWRLRPHCIRYTWINENVLKIRSIALDNPRLKRNATYYIGLPRIRMAFLWSREWIV